MLYYTKLLNLWNKLTESIWFVPSLMTLFGMILASVMIQVDQQVQYKFVTDLRLVYSGGADGARTVLATIASSMLTVAGVSFSIIVVALSLASQQFGPRLLRNFMRDKGNQVVLGTFIGGYMYCLLVLGVIEDYKEGLEIPFFSVTVGIAIALAGIGVFIYFIHHASSSIQASTIVHNVSEELHETLDRLYPEKLGESELKKSEAELPADFYAKSHQVKASKDGYLQAVDNKQLMKLAVEHDLVLLLNFQPGNFVVKDSCLLWRYPEAHIAPEIDRKLDNAFITGHRRTLEQDLNFAIIQLVEIAVRALSPGINDPHTAQTCINYLCTALCQLAQRRYPDAHRFDEEGKLRVVTKSSGFEDFVNLAYDEIRRYGRETFSVSLQQMEALEQIMLFTINDQQRNVLIRQAEMITRSNGITEDSDRRQLLSSYNRLLKLSKK